MDSLIAAAARALAAGDPLAGLKRVALRNDPPALALRGIAMAQLGELYRARELLRQARRAFPAGEVSARARCLVAEAEIAFVSRDLGGPMEALGSARAALALCGDRANSAHAGALMARRLLLIGQLDEAEQLLDGIKPADLRPASLPGYWLVAAGIAMRRIRAEPARVALARAWDAATSAGIPALIAEVERASRVLDAPVARLVAFDGERLLALAEVEALIASGALVVDACRNVVRVGTRVVPFSGRPVLLALARALAEAEPEDVPRETLLARAFRARHADESHRARLRVEISRLRKAVEPLAVVRATRLGFVLEPHGRVRAVVLAPPEEGDHARVLALLADGEAWSSSALALALGASPRTAQRALEALAGQDKVESFGRGRACRWMARQVPGFPTSLLLPASLELG
jgi:tetratricopeptide (TPR) repeat protein